MYDHIGLRVRDVEVARRFYRRRGALVEDGSGFGPAGAPGLWLHEEKQSARRAHRFAPRTARRSPASTPPALRHGRDNGKPGLRPDYSPCYFAAFLVDPDGNNVEAVCQE